MRITTTPIELRTHVQHPYADTDEWRRVSRIAETLHAHLSSEATLEKIALANQPGQSSVAIQATFAEFARELGFESEKM